MELMSFRQKFKAVIPVAGWGTRFLPATKTMPKEMLPIIDKPTIHYIVEELLSAGIEDLIFITGRHKRAVEDYFDRNIDLEEHLKSNGKKELLNLIQKISYMVNPIFIRQKEQKGLGHAILTAKPVIGKDEPFIVSLGDVIIHGENVVKKLIEIHKRVKTSVIALYEVPKEEVNKYGIAKVRPISEDLFIIEDIIEKPTPEEAPSNYAVVGRYLLTPAIFTHLQNTQPGKGNEIQLTDAIRNLLKEEQIYAYIVKGKVFDTGNKLDYLKTILFFAFNREDLREGLKDFLKELFKEWATEMK